MGNLNEKKYNFKINNNMYDKFIACYFTDNKYVSTALKIKIGTFINLLNQDVIIDINIITKIDILKTFYEYFQKYKDTEFDNYLSLFDKSGINNKIYDILNNIERTITLSRDDIIMIDDYINMRLKWTMIYDSSDELFDLITKFRAGNFISMRGIVDDFGDILGSIYTKYNKVKNTIDNRTETLIISEETLGSEIRDIYDELTDDRNMIKTGITALNAMLGGGWYVGRTYLMLALPNNWKSGFLLNSMIWALKYNQHIKPKDPTKTMVALYISLENGRAETVERVFNYSSTNSVRKTAFVDFTDNISESLDLKNSKIKLAIKYSESRTMSTNDIEDVILELGNNGYEVVVVAVDYILRALPNDKRLASTGSPYDVLGIIGTELNNLSKRLMVPIITASQLNRNGELAIEEGVKKNKVGLVELLGRSYVGDSKKLLDDFDDVYIIQPESNPIDISTKYLGIKHAKGRGRRSDNAVPVFYVPFDGNKFRLQEDVEDVEKYGATHAKSIVSIIDHLGLNDEEDKPTSSNLDDIFSR